MKRQENGRTLMEMLGTLAIMGVLSITAIVGFNWAIDKIKANQIYNDIKLAYVDIHTSTGVPYLWTKSPLIPASAHALFIRRDKINNDFVLVKSVEEDVCDILSDMAEDAQEMTLYDIESNLLVCEDEQDIVASFSGEPPLIPCENGVSDCPSKYNSYCDETKVCRKCNLGQRSNDDGMGCVDLCADRTDGLTLSCTSDEMQINWCCPSASICSDIAGECIGDENACIYELKMSDYQADCSGTISISGYKADCSGELTITTNADGTQTASVSTTGCKSGEYCIFAWSEGTWDYGTTEPSLSASHTGTLYGQCHSLLSTSGATPTATTTISTTGCKSGEYCIFAWSEGTWDYGTTEPSLSANHTGTLYGQCHSLLSTSGAMATSQASLNPIKECNGNKYCDIRWPVSDCASTLKADHTGRFYGACAEWTKTNTSCPAGQDGFIVE